jgi:serpin B
MITQRSLLTLLLTLVLAGNGCGQDPEESLFDYNLKSAKVIETNNDFGLNLVRTVLGTEEKANVMISPASVSIALGMAYNGAGSSTLEAFEEVLDYKGVTREEVNEITRELIHVLATNVDGNLLEIANSIWYDKGFPVESEFISLNSHYFNAGVNEIDFRQAEAVTAINDWVKENTHGKIDKIINSIDPDVVMYLINAIYFNCVWETEFDPDNTRPADFFQEDGSLYGKVDMMHLKADLNMAGDGSFSAVELPYKNGKFSMFLFLPAGESSLAELIGDLDGATWKRWQESFSKQKDVILNLPKFEFEYGRPLASDLRKLGLDIAFTDQADFSGISPVDLLISDVIHKTYIKVNEEGTEAAAVTAVEISPTALGPVYELTLNRPFLFAITENSSQSILFMGKVSEPEY